MTAIVAEGLHAIANEYCTIQKPPEECPYDSSPPDQGFSVSIGVVLLAFMASEVLIMALCKIAAWYAHVSFYSQFSSSSYMDYWDGDYESSSRDRYNIIQQTLSTRRYSLAETERNIQNDMWCFSADTDAYDDDICCSICLGEFEEHDAVSSGRSCHHLFHEQCITQWLQKHSTCPYCRADMLSESKQTMEKVAPQNNATHAVESHRSSDQLDAQRAPVNLWRLLCTMLESRQSLDDAFCEFFF